MVSDPRVWRDPNAKPRAPAPRGPLADDAERASLLAGIDHGLSAWEVDFVDAVAKRVEDGEALTARQREVADAILKRRGL